MITKEQKQEIEERMTLAEICAARNVLIMQRRMMGDKPDESVIAYLQEKLGNPPEDRLVHVSALYRNFRLENGCINAGLIPEHLLEWEGKIPETSGKLTGYVFGDFVEFFDDDALVASEVFNTTLTRYTGTQARFSGRTLTGIPLHALETYRAIAKSKGFELELTEWKENTSI